MFVACLQVSSAASLASSAQGPDPSTSQSATSPQPQGPSLLGRVVGLPGRMLGYSISGNAGAQSESKTE